MLSLLAYLWLLGPPELDDDDIPIDEDLEEQPAAARRDEPAKDEDADGDGEDREASEDREAGEQDVLEILVDASALGDGTQMDAFTFAGGRTVVDSTELRERGATNVGEALERAPGVRAVEGNSGIGSQGTALQVSVRGANPRLSARATVMLDEIPIAPAPYGQPQLSLFPLSLFSIADVDVVRGGATARYGPQTSGGVFNLVSNPIPEHPRIAIFSQYDSNRDISLGGSYGATHGKFGMYLEYAPRLGKSYREHSDKQVHGGLAKFAWQFNPRVRLESLTHGYAERSELPGGLTRAAFEIDPFMSTRPFDYFKGSRIGTALTLKWQPSERQDVKIAGWYNHSYRTTVLANSSGFDRTQVNGLVAQPRYYDVLGVEPRWSMRFDVDNVDFSHQLSAGARVGYEMAKLQANLDEFGDGSTTDILTTNIDARTAAYAAYVAERFIMLGGDLTVDVGVRLEFLQIGWRDLIARTTPQRDYWAPLPAASLWYSPVDEFALFLAYGRSFSSASYLQLSATPTPNWLNPETSDSVELGLKTLELGGFYAESTVWYRYFRNYLDEGDTTFDLINKVHVWGIETDLSWYPGEVWDMPGELELYAGYGWTRSEVYGLTYSGNTMPWYPEHEAWAGASYAFEFGTTLGADFAYMGRQYTDYQNLETENQLAGGGPIPAYATLNIWASTEATLPNHWQLEFTGGVKNVTDTRYISRTDDRNAGILVGRPRTYYINFGLAHDFMPRKQGRARTRAGSSARTSGRMDQVDPFGA